MKQSGILQTVKQVMRDNPTLTLRYDIQSACYAKRADECPTAVSHFTGDKKISLRRLAAGAVLLSAISLGLCISDLVNKKK
jgi:hypothetical protein